MNVKINHEEVVAFIEQAEHRSWSFESALGDTIKEKFESFYVELHNITEELVKQDVSANILVAGPLIASFFECFFQHGKCDYEDNDYVVKIRNVNKWDVYKDKLMDDEMILITEKKLEKGIVLKTDAKSCY